MKKKKLLVTASTFPRWRDDTEPRFILDYAIGLRSEERRVGKECM